MTPLQVIDAEQPFFANDALAAQVIARPNQKATPPIESWPFLLQPKALHLRLSKSTCGSSCAGCEIHSVRAGNRAPEPEFPLAAWERVRDHWLPDLTGLEVSGLGEPTVASLFPQIARETLASGKILYFPTHGRYLALPKVLDALGDGSNVRVSISMDACDDASYVACGRGKKGDWAKMLAAVQAFKEHCPKAQLHSQFTGFSYTIDALPGWMQVCADLGIRETIFRLGMAVGEISREDTSLRFLKDKTEAAIYQAQLIAEANGIAFEVERRPYSEVQPNGLDAMSTPDRDAPVNRLRRYLDLAPMSVFVCGSGVTTTVSDGKTCTTIFGPVSTRVVSGTDAPYIGSTVTTSAYFVEERNTIVCGTSSCTRTTLFEDGYTRIISSNGTLVSANTFRYTFSTPATTDTCAGFGTMSSEGEAEIIRSIVVPRGTNLAAMSTPTFQPISPIDASPVVWADGSISSCFAKHMIGNIFSDTMQTLVTNPDYQAFLQHRDGSDGGVSSSEWCVHCPRNF